MSTITFYYDVVSPYSYVAFEQLLRHRAQWDKKGCKVILKPFLLVRSGSFRLCFDQ